MTQFFEAAAALGGEAVISLYEVDLNPIRVNSILRFCSHANAAGNANVVFLGNTYQTLDVEAAGFEWTSQGPIPQPTLKLSNVTNIISSLLRDYRDLIGARVTRIRTFARYLADGADATLASQSYTTDIYSIERKTAHNKQYVEWRLSAAMDQEGRMLPNRLILRDSCQWRYRRWNGTAWDYSQATCPYTGGAMFDMNGAPTGDPTRDVCSKRVATGCRVRFNSVGQDVLPFGGFPSVSRIR